VKLDRRVLWTCLALYAAAQILFLIQIGTPKGFSFDEFHYVPSAKQFLAHQQNQNWEHPPLGKMIMAVGIATFGDKPLGWRFMSTIFGALTLVGMYLWGLALFRDRNTALWVALITFVNHLLYVQSRIGMLDTFMFAFIVWGVAAFTASWDPDAPPQQVRKLLAFSGWMFGLATATKWFGLMAWMGCLGLVVLVRLLQIGKFRIEDSREDDWYSPQLWKGIKWTQWVHYLVIHPIVAYAICFIPRLMIEHQGPWYEVPVDFLEMQARMFDGQLRVVTQHPYMSHWRQWPLMTRPIWYAFEHEDPGLARGVVLLGNPLVMWGGLFAILGCFVEWVRFRARDAFLIIFFYFVFYGSWIIIPRKVSFYYYYYPAGMVLGLALAYAFHHGEQGPMFKYHWARWTFLVAASILFIYFLPVLAGTPIQVSGLGRWMWFRSWI
jgi:dolichyl-phosphate-mannose--protein O-mannosyl transferase